MCLGKNTENETSTIKDTIINNSKEEKILGVIIENRLTFSSHIREVCKKGYVKKYRLCQEYQTNLMILKKILLFNAVVKSQINYYPLVWMFCSRTSNSMINRVHERALRVIVGDDLSDFESLLQNNRQIRSHHKNIQNLMIEIFKIKNELAPPIMD